MYDDAESAGLASMCSTIWQRVGSSRVESRQGLDSRLLGAAHQQNDFLYHEIHDACSRCLWPGPQSRLSNCLPFERSEDIGLRTSILPMFDYVLLSES